MNLIQWQSWPLGPIPVFLTLWGIYWLVHILLRPKKNWLSNENSNTFAVYSVAATIALGLAYAIRQWFVLPIYIFRFVNWLPILVTVLTYIAVDFLERVLKGRLGYMPSTEHFLRRWRRVWKLSSTHELKMKKRLILFLFIGTLTLEVILPDSDNFEERNGYYWLIGTLLGNIHMQAGLTWALSCITATLLRIGYVYHLTGQEVQRKTEKENG